VLPIGDSITRTYYPAVATNLASIGDERLPRQLAEYCQKIQISFDVVQFNNGMHGWAYTEDEYRTYFGETLAAVRN